MEIMMKIVYGGYDKDSNDRKKLQTAYYIHFTYPINSIQLSQVNKTILVHCKWKWQWSFVTLVSVILLFSFVSNSKYVVSGCKIKLHKYETIRLQQVLWSLTNLNYRKIRRLPR